MLEKKTRETENGVRRCGILYLEHLVGNQVAKLGNTWDKLPTTGTLDLISSFFYVHFGGESMNFLGIFNTCSDAFRT